VTSTGALAQTETEIEGLLDVALRAVDALPGPAREALVDLALLAVHRER
jgi:hypothetical protein